MIRQLLGDITYDAWRLFGALRECLPPLQVDFRWALFADFCFETCCFQAEEGPQTLNPSPSLLNLVRRTRKRCHIWLIYSQINAREDEDTDLKIFRNLISIRDTGLELLLWL